MSADRKGRGWWKGRVVEERIDALDRMDRNVPGVSHSETARRLSRGRWEIGPFSRNWVARRRRQRAERESS